MSFALSYLFGCSLASIAAFIAHRFRRYDLNLDSGVN